MNEAEQHLRSEIAKRRREIEALEAALEVVRGQKLFPVQNHGYAAPQTQ